MSSSYAENEPPDGLFFGIGLRTPEKKTMLVCSDCGIVEVVTTQLLASATILNNQAFPVCTRCGTQFLIVPENN